MSDAPPLLAAIEAAEERSALEARAARADQLERDLAFERAGIPDSPVGDLFIGAYTGPLDVSEVKLGWAYVSGDVSDLDDVERHTFEFRMARARAQTRKGR